MYVDFHYSKHGATCVEVSKLTKYGLTYAVN